MGSVRESDGGGTNANRGVRLPGKVGNFGFSLGIGMGQERCKTTLICTNESSCCNNANGCGC
jgi:hypothetical protein